MSALSPFVALARRRMPVDPGRTRLARYLGPAAFLLVATVLVLVVQSTMRSNESPARKTPSQATNSASHTPPRPSGVPAPKHYYVIAGGDTLDAVAARFGTSVDALFRLNPGIEATALRPGEHIRVK